MLLFFYNLVDWLRWWSQDYRKHTLLFPSQELGGVCKTACLFI